jgi:hypothetical protein
MKKLFFLLISLSLIQCSASKNSDLILKYSPVDYLYWSETRKLTWNDFQKPSDASDNYTSEVDMSIPSSVEKENIFIQPRLISICVFDKKNSWVNKKFANDTLLLYNQTIFDIHELYARKLRKIFSETDLNADNYKDKFKSMTEKNNSDLLNRVEEFRRESNFGENKKIVLQWAAKIKSELQDLSQFKVEY